MTTAAQRVRDRARTITRGLPLLLKFGFGVLGVGLALDLGMHLLGTDPGPTGHAHGVSSGAASIHALVLIGMGVSIVGLLSTAFRRPSAREHDPERIEP